MFSFIFFLATQVFAQTSDLYTAPANPLALSVNLNSSGTVRKLINPKEGGTLELIDSKKNKFKLTIPAQAISESIEFSMTEIRELGGEVKVSSEKTLGVVIEPAGTEFAKLATLEIWPANSLQVKELVPFSYYNQGENTHLTFAKLAADKIMMPLAHLSGYGVLQSMQFRKDAVTHLSNLLTDRVQNVLVEESIKLQNGEIDQLPKDFTSKVAEDFFNQIIKPSMGQTNSCRQAEAVADLFLKLQRILSLSGDEDAATNFIIKHGADFAASWSSSISQCAKQFGENCVNEGLYSAFLTFELSTLRRCNFIENFSCEKLDGYQELLSWEKRCLNFEVSFKNSFTQKENPGPDLKIDLKVQYPISPSNTNIISPEVKYEVQVPQFASGTDSGLKCKLVGVNSNPGVFHLDLIDILKMRSNSFGKTSIWFDLGMPTTVAHGKCVETSDPSSEFDITLPPNDTGSYYAGLFRAVHDFEFDKDYGMYRFTEVQVNFNSSILVRKTFSFYSSDIMMTEDFDFVMKHNPK